ncbi:MAG TPA: hypothetical protein VK488_07525 [Gaiellaceae bacterium]|nr:hypothetical protein [Gaiellaceae bacterium]
MRPETQEALERATALAREYLEGLEERDPDRFKVGVIGLVFETDFGEQGGIGYACSDDRYWIQAALFRAAVRQAESTDAESEW